MAVWALGINHTTAPLDLRGRFAFAPEQYAGRNGGFTRITKLGPRLGDGAEVVVLELL